jgi:hypothetical protein
VPAPATTRLQAPSLTPRRRPARSSRRSSSLSSSMLCSGRRRRSGLRLVACRFSKKDDALKAQRFRPPARFRRPARARNGTRPVLRPAACAPEPAGWETGIFLNCDPAPAGR